MKKMLLVVMLVIALAAVPPASAAPAAANAVSSLAGTGLPHPVLESRNVRRALAHCIDKDALIAAAYPYLTPAERQDLRLDTFFPKEHWAYTAPSTVYAYDPPAGRALLEAAGWTLAPGDAYRMKGGRELALALNITGAEMRRAYATVLASQLAGCGARLNVNYTDSDWLFGLETGLARRDFELSSYAWIIDPADTTLADLYSCGGIPAAANGWVGANYMGYCNPAVDTLLAQADDAGKTQLQRAALYAQAMELILQDLPSIPLFDRDDSLNTFEHLDLNLNLTVQSPTLQSHPVLKTAAVRQAIAHCIDKDAVIAAVYPQITPAERQNYRLDTLFPKNHWAYTPPAPVYAYDPPAGRALLDAAGWTLAPGATYRAKGGRELALTLTTTNAAPRQAYVPVIAAQLAACGVRLTPSLQNASLFFGENTGLGVRDFEITTFAWVISEAPQFAGLYGCGAVPSPANGWAGQNYMGYCNPAVDALLAQADDAGKTRPQRAALYAQAVELILQDAPTIPLYARDGGDVIEHLDFNLDSALQAGPVSASAQTEIPVVTFDGQGSVSVPPGAVSQPVGLAFTPLVGAANPPEAGKSAVLSFALTALVNGQPQAGFAFNQPVLIRMQYNDAKFENFDESTLRLYLWDGGRWQDAALSCPPASRHFALDTAQNTFSVHVCHLTEFSLIGDDRYQVMLPMVRR